MIEIIGTTLNQWDTGRSVQVTEIEADHVHFANKGDSKAVIMEIADSQAKIPDYLLQTGKQVCVYAVKSGVTVESKIFYVKTRERPANYVYEDDQRNYIYELIANAETAVENAILAAKNANEAADNANDLRFTGFAEGDSIHLDDATNQSFVGLRVFGKTTQYGTPTPEAPVELESVENPTVMVNDQTLLIPYTLHGIPVTSGGNYTDENGQHWICDEIDFAKGVLVQRLYQETYNGSEEWMQDINGMIYIGQTVMGCIPKPLTQGLMCSHFKRAANPGVAMGNDYGITLYSDEIRSLDSWKAWLAQNSITVLYERGTPTETSLSEEELAAFATLHTYRGSTTVSNDASAHMEIEYAMDIKKYIDSIIGTTASAARIAYVNLLASQWTGSGNLYSQVVSIAGITENSQINLAPSVEQLSIFYEKDITFVTENDGGVVTVYVIGQKPQNDYTIQADIVEVIE